MIQSTPLITLLLSFPVLIENMICLTISLKVSMDISMGSSFSISGREVKSSPEFPFIERSIFCSSFLICMVKSSPTSIFISPSGIFLTASMNMPFSIAAIPAVSILPSTTVSIPRSESLAVKVIFPPDALISMNFCIGMVVLTGTAPETILIPLSTACLEAVIFIRYPPS